MTLGTWTYPVHPRLPLRQYARRPSATINATGIGASAAFRTTSRTLRSLNVVDARPNPSDDGSVVAAVRAELDGSPGAVERPGLTAVALALAAIFDDPQHMSVRPAAARQLVSILGTLSKRTQHRGKLGVVKAMTTSSRAEGAH